MRRFYLATLALLSIVIAAQHPADCAGLSEPYHPDHRSVRAGRQFRRHPAHRRQDAPRRYWASLSSSKIAPAPPAASPCRRSSAPIPTATRCSPPMRARTPPIRRCCRISEYDPINDLAPVAYFAESYLGADGQQQESRTKTLPEVLDVLRIRTRQMELRQRRRRQPATARNRDVPVGHGAAADRHGSCAVFRHRAGHPGAGRRPHRVPDHQLRDHHSVRRTAATSARSRACRMPGGRRCRTCPPCRNWATRI